jgi:DNA polymerase III subunit delta'
MIIGQDDAVAEFNQALAQNRLPQSWIFLGPKGVGKASFAQKIARDILANSLPESVPSVPAEIGLFGELSPPAPKPQLSIHDPAHPLFQAIENRTHPDVLQLDLASLPKKNDKPRTELLVDDLRQVHDFLRQTSLGNHWRIVIIDDAETMNVHAANALLKILEEPPEKSLLLLIASSLGQLPPTIRSRCRVLRFAPLPPSVLRPILQLQYPELTPPDLDWLCELCRGSLGLAQEIMTTNGIQNIRVILQNLANPSWAGNCALAETMAGAGSAGLRLLALALEMIIHPELGQNQEIVRQLRQQRAPRFWLEELQALQKLATAQQLLYLDLKQSWLNALTRMAA